MNDLSRYKAELIKWSPNGEKEDRREGWEKTDFWLSVFFRTVDSSPPSIIFVFNVLLNPSLTFQNLMYFYYDWIQQVKQIAHIFEDVIHTFLCTVTSHSLYKKFKVYAHNNNAKAIYEAPKLLWKKDQKDVSYSSFIS